MRCVHEVVLRHSNICVHSSVLCFRKAGREKVKVFGAWLDADVAGRKAGQGNRAAGLVARSERGETLTDKEKAEVKIREITGPHIAPEGSANEMVQGCT